MGYMRHHAIIVTGMMPEIEAAHRRAAEIFGPRNSILPNSIPVTPITFKVINGFQSFSILPDGSKEGWAESTEGDEKRDEFVNFLKDINFPDGTSSLDWVEVQFGDDDGDTKIIRSNDDE
jgi:hypothetical protein